MTRLLLIFLLFWSAPLFAQAPVVGQEYADRQLTDPDLEAKATQLMFELRCVQCQGQSVADSDAPIALTMRHEVRSRIQAGQSPDEVRQFFVSRYGEYISFEPSTRGGGLLLWIAPVILFLAAVFVALRNFRKRKA